MPTPTPASVRESLLNTAWLGKRWKAFLPRVTFRGRSTSLDSSSARAVMAKKWLSTTSQAQPIFDPLLKIYKNRR
jgi:hypothetical protein